MIRLILFKQVVGDTANAYLAFTVVPVHYLNPAEAESWLSRNSKFKLRGGQTNEPNFKSSIDIDTSALIR